MYEIRDWAKMSDQERDKIMGQIEERMLVHFGVSPRKKPA